MSAPERRDTGGEVDHLIKVDNDQLELLALAVDALAAAAGDRGASDRMGDFFNRMEEQSTQEDVVASCQDLYDIIRVALESKE